MIAITSVTFAVGMLVGFVFSLTIAVVVIRQQIPRIVSRSYEQGIASAVAFLRDVAERVPLDPCCAAALRSTTNRLALRSEGRRSA